MRTKTIRAAFGCVLMAHGAALVAEAPIPVSPGASEEVTVEGRCPTFSWAPVAGVGAQDLVVYRLPEDPGGESEAVVKQRLPGAAGSWTPAGEACLERGARYAWSVRGLDGEASGGEWSKPSLFRVAPAPGVAELERQLAEARRRLAERELGGEDQPRIGTYLAPGETLVVGGGDPGARSRARPMPRSHAAGGMFVDGESVPSGLEIVGRRLAGGPFMMTGNISVYIAEGTNVCPAGKMAISGGFETGGMHALTSKPGPTGIGWELRLNYNSSTPLTTEIDFWVGCAHP